jgi:GT2 family glycosyltransferase
MDVSVIILNYNTFDLTCNCIRSVLRETTGCSFEIIVVDNASTEKEPKEFLKLFPGILLVENKANTGFARGNNCGLEIARGNFALLLNSDAELKNNAILICLEAMRQYARVAVIGCRLEYPQGSVQHNCQRFPSLRYKLFELFRLQKVLPSKVAGKILLGYFFEHNEVVFPDWIWGTFFMFERALLRLFPKEQLADDFFMYVEDMQWCMDFKKLGYKIAFEPRARVIHHMGKANDKKLPLMEVNTGEFLKRYYSGWRISLIKHLDNWLQSGRI